MNKNYLSTIDLAKLLGVSRIAVYKQIKAGKIKAKRKGRKFVIDKKELGGILKTKLTEKQKAELKRGVKKVVREYGETLRLLSET